MNTNFKILKILIPALVLTLGLDYVSAFYSPRPTTPPTSSNVSGTNTPLSFIYANSSSPQTRVGSLTLGSTASPTAVLDVRGSTFSKNLYAFGYTRVGSAVGTPNGMSLTSGGITAKDVYLNNINPTGRAGTRKLCADGSGHLDVCPPEKGEWIRTTPGSHRFIPSSELPVGVTEYKIELWGSGGNSVPSTDSNPGNEENHTNPADPSYVTEYEQCSTSPSGFCLTGKSMYAQNGRMGTHTIGGGGGTASVAGITGATIVSGGSGQSSKVYSSGNRFADYILIPNVLFQDVIPSVIPSIFSVSHCVGGMGGASARSPGAPSGSSRGGIGGDGGHHLNQYTGKEGVNWGSGGGGRGNAYASSLLCNGPWPYTNDAWGKKAMSSGGGAGGYVSAKFPWVEGQTDFYQYAIEIGEGGKLNGGYDYGSGNGANGAVRISW